MTKRTSRRRFLQATAAAGAGYWVAGGIAPRPARAANEAIQFGCVGIGGKGASDSQDAAKYGKVVAICDIDDDTLNKSGSEVHREATKFNDFREMFDKLGDKVDAVTVSTPDHTHAVVASKALSMGKHVYCQKPMTHSIYEARYLGELARKNKCITQMGNQGTAEDGLREAAALIRGGAIGKPREVHVWTNRPVWPQGMPALAEEKVPNTVKWDLFIGPAPFHPYNQGYHPFKWRGFWDFGTGALGDMACHTLNMAFMGCQLLNPTSVQASTSGHNKVTYPGKSKIQFDFPANDWRGAITLYWYDGGLVPSKDLFKGATMEMADSGSLVIGESGMIFSPNDYGAKFEQIGGESMDIEFDSVKDHFGEFADGITKGTQPTSNFPDYAGPLTEVILLGNLAVWAADQDGVQGPKVDWDAKELKVKGTDAYDSIVKHTYRDGWALS
jgi:predicted dehydrogenase